MFVAIQLIIQMCPSLLCWRLNLALQVSQGSASTCFRWSGHFRHSFVKGLFRKTPSNFYWNRFIFDRQGAKNKLAQFFWDMVYNNSSDFQPTDNSLLTCAISLYSESSLSSKADSHFTVPGRRQPALQ